MNTDPLISTQLANYRIERQIGQGGMARVYYGRDVKLQRPVAIKVIDTRFQHNPEYARRFVQEARAIATWRHENVVQVYYADKQDGLYYFAMEYIDGTDLSNLLEDYSSEGTLMPHEDILRIGKSVASALDYAHQKGVIHRDIKPANVMIDREERVVLMDFGLALDASQGTRGETFGTAHYIAPEQARNSSNAIAASDIYSFGVMLYEMLTGAVPFDDPAITAVAIQHLTQPPPAPTSINPSLNEETEQVLLKVLSKEPNDRHASASELMIALEKALSSKKLATEEFPLPPVPGAVNRAAGPQLSRVSVAEKIAIRESAKPTPLTYPGEQPPPVVPPPARSAPYVPPVQGEIATPPQKRNNGLLYGVLGAIIMLAIIGIFALILFTGGNNDENTEPTSDNDVIAQTTETVPTVEATDPPADNATEQPTIATDEPTEEEATDLSAATEAVPEERPSATPTSSMTPTFTSQPTFTPTASATIPPTTAVPTAITLAATPVPAEPTVAYPNGKPVLLIYNNRSLYIKNQSSNRLLAASLRFEALNASGAPSGRAFDGERWTAVSRYGYLDINSCSRLEISNGSPWLRPADCRNYNAVVTPTQNDIQLFWTNLDSAVEFRILWNGNEVARCPIATENEQRCEVKLP